jgi:PAS domain S-box-containing protein
MDLLARQAADYFERKQAEQKQQEASAQLRRFLDAVPTGLTRCSRDLRYVAANPAYAEMAGFPVEQIVGRPIVDVMGAEAWETILPHVERVLRGERVEYETALPYSAGGTRQIHVVYTPDIQGGGQVVGWFASVTDITEFKQIEWRLQKMEKFAAAGQLAASLAHEISNPLSSVENVFYLLRDDPQLDSQARYLANIGAAELQRAARIVKQSLSCYRVDSLKEIDLAELLEESLRFFGNRLERAGIQLDKRITTGTTLVGFAHEVRQVIDNLLLNAVEATPPGGRIIVSLRPSHSWSDHVQPGVRFTLADTGCGVPKAHFSRIFEPFFTTKAEKGTGLGLWVVNGIIARHEATIRFRSIQSMPRSGTVFSILWPSQIQPHLAPGVVCSGAGSKAGGQSEFARTRH